MQPSPGSFYNESNKTSALKVGQGYYFWVNADTQQAYIDWLKANGFNHSNVWGLAGPTMPLAHWMVDITSKGITASDVLIYAGYGHPSQSMVMDQRTLTQKAHTITAPLETVPSFYSMSTLGKWGGGYWTDDDVVVGNFPAKTPGAIQFEKSGTYTLSFYLINDKAGEVMSPTLTMEVTVT